MGKVRKCGSFICQRTDTFGVNYNFGYLFIFPPSYFASSTSFSRRDTLLLWFSNSSVQLEVVKVEILPLTCVDVCMVCFSEANSLLPAWLTLVFDQATPVTVW